MSALAYQPRPFVEHLFDAAWQQYEAATCKAATLESQPDLFDTAKAEAAHWRGIVDALGQELRHGTAGA